ncbi:MAG: tetratricopeptide repeat protein [Bacteroidia bacterium]
MRDADCTINFISKYLFPSVLLTAFLCFFSVTRSFAFDSNTQIDSLKGLLQKQPSDTGKVIILNKLSFQYNRIGSNDKALNAARAAFDLSNKLAYKRGEAKSLINTGNVFLAKADLENAKKVFSSAYLFAKEIEDLRILSDCNNNLGEVFRLQGDYQKSLSYYLESLKIEETLSNKEGISETLNNIGILYEELGNFEKAIESYKRSMEISKELKSDYILSTNLLNIAQVYFEDEQLEQALDYFQQALLLKKKVNDKSGVGQSLLGIGNIYLKLNKTGEAMKNYSQSLEIAQSIGDKQATISCLLDIGLIYERDGKYNKAIEYENASLALCLETGLKPETRDSYLILARTYSGINNPKEALRFFNLYIALNDSLYNNQSTRQIAEMQAKYESEKKQKENEVLAQKNQLLDQQSKIQELKIKQSRYFISGLLFLLLLIVGIAFLFIRQNRTKAMYAKIEMEQKLLRSQLNPHFIFNAMVGIQNYIYKEEPEVAANYLSSVVQLMRAIIDNSKKEFVSLEKEISTLHHYLTLQKVRFQDRFDFKIETGPDVDPENMLIPPMMAQPVIENAIVHGILKKTGQGIITVGFYLQDNYLSLSIEDNGIGRKRASESEMNTESHLSIATGITEERLKMLNRKTRNKSSMKIIDLKGEDGQPSGTRVVFLFPLA